YGVNEHVATLRRETVSVRSPTAYQLAGRRGLRAWSALAVGSRAGSSGPGAHGLRAATRLLLQRPGVGVPQRAVPRRVVTHPGLVILVVRLVRRAVRDERRLLVQRQGEQVRPQLGVRLVGQVGRLGRVGGHHHLVQQRVHLRVVAPDVVLLGGAVL